jgi:hypothetical protein
MKPFGRNLFFLFILLNIICSCKFNASLVRSNEYEEGYWYIFKNKKLNLIIPFPADYKFENQNSRVKIPHYLLNKSPIVKHFWKHRITNLITARTTVFPYFNCYGFLLKKQQDGYYKNFDFGMNMRASIGNHVFNATSATRSFYNSLVQGASLQNVSSNVLNTNFDQQNLDTILSDKNVENASFLRVDYFTAGYTFPKWLDGKASLRLFTSVQNPILITNYKGLDPEINGGVDNTIYPRQRQILVGANVKF